MCGIAGLVSPWAQALSQHHVETVRAMCARQHHRGPDQHDVVSLDQVCLGANRLSIIDLGAAGRMPMADAEGDLRIVYNGEVYNFAELRQELVELGVVFRSRTDTEVVLYAYKHWGAGCLERFSGMFAFAIYDRRRRSLFLARDRFGKKPLYYTDWNGDFLFASELKALLAVCDGRRPDHRRVLEWCLYRNSDFGAPRTLVDGISALPPGHYLELQGGRPQAPVRYYSAIAEVDAARYAAAAQRAPEEVINTTEGLLVDAIDARLVSDVPVGTLCSGGLDSSLITALCARRVKDVAAFHVSVVGQGAVDESVHARQVARALGIDLQVCTIRPENFRANLVRALYYGDLPITHPNSVALLLVAELAKSQGVSVLLSGEAADELFGGYLQRYRRQRLYLRLRRVLARLSGRDRRLIALSGHAIEGVPITGFSEYSGLLAHTLACIDGFAREDLRKRCSAAYGFLPSGVDREMLGAMLADLEDFLAPLLRRLDRTSMAASVESRVPFLDHRLVREVLNLPLAYRVRGRTDKWLLKQIAARHLPRNIVSRAKVGFPLPIADYVAPLADQRLFRDGFCIGELGMHPQGLLDSVGNWRRNVNGFFNLLALELWGRLFFWRQSQEVLEEQLRSLEPAARAGRMSHGLLRAG